MIKFRKGQSILEVVIATTLISMGVIAALSLTNQSQKSSNYSKLQGTATAYNNQVADYLRNQKITLGYESLQEKFTTDSSDGVAIYCLPNLPETTELFLSLNSGLCDPATDKIPGTVLYREVRIETSDSETTGILPITITTSWEDNTLRTTTLNLELSKWK